MTTDILVGIDASANSDHALTWALDEAEFRGARVRAVLTWSYLGQGDSKLGMGTTEDDAKAALAEVIERVAGDRAHLVDQVTVCDLPVPGILEQAASAALVVVGTRGRGGLKKLVLGSTSRDVVNRSPVPVVVVPIPH